MRPAVALALYGVWFALAFGVRSWLQWRRTGSTGFRGVSGRPGSPEWLAGVGFVVALAAGAAAPVLEMTGAVEPFGPLNAGWVGALGAAAAVAGIAGTWVAQVSMGDAWRVGVDPAEDTELVSTGAFGVVRNPIFSMMLVTAVGLTLLVPDVVAVCGLVALIVALELQVRIVEEPHLAAMHGRRYREYAAGAGRFVPGIGRVRPDGGR